jgi:hypothetical protein
MPKLRETLGGLWALLRLAAASRFRLGGRYWRWREETAFGADPSRRPRWSERARQVMRYGRWVSSMRRGLRD